MSGPLMIDIFKKDRIGIDLDCRLSRDQNQKTSRKAKNVSDYLHGKLKVKKSYLTLLHILAR